MALRIVPKVISVMERARMAKKILIIDDAPSVTQLMEYWLKSAGYDVYIAQDGLQGFELAKKQKPDLILLDIMIPKLDGYTVCRLLKNDKQYQHIPIVMVTAREQKEDKELGLKAGASAYLEKPIEEDTLLKKILELTKK